jgi:drug/metabolite transporter (DMT)-like permease
MINPHLHPPLALATAAVVWGLIWYPYRALHADGIGPALASALTYCIAFAVALLALRRRLSPFRITPALAVIALAAAWSNVGFIVAIVQGEVVRVTLLFYLAPFWTILFARWLLDERLDRRGWMALTLALPGAATMLWEPRVGLPLPRDGADWMALTGGMAFALSNVLIRREHATPIAVKSVAVLGICAILGFAAASWTGLDVERLAAASPQSWVLVLWLGIVLLVVNLVVQYGLTHTAANRAIVIYLLELVVAAASAAALAGEFIDLRKLIGGGLIVAGTLLSRPRSG